MNIKKGDTVLIIKGKDRNKNGKVIKVYPKENKVVVEGLNLVKKIKRARREGEKGEIISVPRPIDRSNVMLICPHCKKPTKIAIRRKDKIKHRVCKKCGSNID
ncbi:MAG: 50S ribosomal protein L24 [Minisyncoccia bacterium]|jgi:large subunit ribosomal protein L24